MADFHLPQQTCWSSRNSTLRWVCQWRANEVLLKKLSTSLTRALFYPWCYYRVNGRLWRLLSTSGHWRTWRKSLWLKTLTSVASSVRSSSVQPSEDGFSAHSLVLGNETGQWVDWSVALCEHLAQMDNWTFTENVLMYGWILKKKLNVDKEGHLTSNGAAKIHQPIIFIHNTT